MLRVLHDAITAEVDPSALVDPIDPVEINTMIDSLAGIARTLDELKSPALNRVYRALDVNMVYQAEEQAINVMACSRVASSCVRGGT